MFSPRCRVCSRFPSTPRRWAHRSASIALFGLSLAATLLLGATGPTSTAVAAEWAYESMQDVYSTCIHEDHVHGRIFVGTVEGFHYLGIGTGAWTSRDWVGWIGRQVYAVDWHPDLDQRVITGRENAFFKGYIELSDDLGLSEEIVYSSNAGSVTGLAHDPADGDRRYACTWSDVAPGEIVRSLDGGESWTLLPATIHYAMTSITIDASGTVYVGGSSRVTRSIDGGDTWEPAYNGLPVGYGVYDVEADPEGSGRLMATNDLGIYRSLDGGDTWTQVHGVGCRKLDWARSGVIVPGVRSTQTVAAVTWDERILVSHDLGETWADETGNLPGEPVDVVFSVTDGYTYVATYGAGTFKARIPIPQDVNLLPASGGLRLSRPCPFRPGDAIGFHLERDAHVTVEIFDSGGRLVARPLIGSRTRGAQRAVWSASGRPDGVYWARVRSGRDSECARLLLVR